MRLDIQALRAIAILTVVVFHIWVYALPGGFIGVDIFFVISGYLITGQLWREVAKTGKIAFNRFWARRARRLLPASLLVILSTLILCLLFLPASLFLKFVNDGSAAAFYIQNWALAARATDYLQNDGTESAFQHFWSLSVEEQYYVFWPIVMAFALVIATVFFKRFKNHLRVTVIVMLSVMTAVSLWYSVVTTTSQPELAYFSTFTRAWEFSAGALLAVSARTDRGPAQRRNPLWFWLGLALVVVALVRYNTTTPFPSYRAALPVLGALLMLYGGESLSRFMPRAAFRFKPIKFLGDTSYSLYLWHWPLLVVAPWVIKRDPNWVDGFGILAIALFLGWASKRFVEDPIRFGKLSTFKNRNQLLLSGVAMLAILGATTASAAQAEVKLVTGWANQNLSPRLSDAAKDLPPLERGSCHAGPTSTKFITCPAGVPEASSKVRVLFVGDSHTRQYTADVMRLAKKYQWRVTIISKSACPVIDPDLFPNGLSYESCPKWNRDLISYLAANKKFDLAITSSSTLVTGGYPGSGAAFRSAIEKEFLDRGTKVMVIRDNPKPRKNFLACIESFGPTAETDCQVTREAGLTPNDGLYAAVKDLDGVIAADLTDIYCSSVCSPVINGIIVYRDNSHITNTFAATLQPAIDALVPEEFKK
jgi:peptidoglycan/LPS O-acetylase OafA/YrhL